MPLPVFADVDTGVDDAMALVYLLANPDARLVGVASTGETFRSSRCAGTTWGYWNCAGPGRFRSRSAPHSR